MLASSMEAASPTVGRARSSRSAFARFGRLSDSLRVCDALVHGFDLGLQLAMFLKNAEKPWLYVDRQMGNRGEIEEPLTFAPF